MGICGACYNVGKSPYMGSSELVNNGSRQWRIGGPRVRTLRQILGEDGRLRCLLCNNGRLESIVVCLDTVAHRIIAFSSSL